MAGWVLYGIFIGVHYYYGSTNGLAQWSHSMMKVITLHYTFMDKQSVPTQKPT